jgi:magnesium chelatase family protein
MNPCPCGYLGASNSKCNCSQEQIQRYRGKISGPLLDRIDMVVDVQALKKEQLLEQDFEAENSDSIRYRVTLAMEKQFNRQGKTNQTLDSDEVIKLVNLTADNKKLLEKAIDKLDLSARAYFKILRLARTIADLKNEESVEQSHLIEAITYRRNL